MDWSESDEISSSMDVCIDNDAPANPRVIELIIYPPKYENNTARMLQADTLRWKIGLPSGRRFPGYYISNDGENLVLVPASDSESTAISQTVGVSYSSLREEVYSACASVGAAATFDLPHVNTLESGLSDLSTSLSSGAWTDIIAAAEDYQKKITEWQASTATTTYPPQCYIRPPPMNESHHPYEQAVHALQPSTNLARSSMTNARREGDSWSKGISITKAAENCALYTTNLSWGQCADDLADMCKEIDDDDMVVGLPQGCKMGIETGSALSWVYKTGYKEIDDPRFSRGDSVKILEWSQGEAEDSQSDFELAQRRPSVAFSSSLDSLSEYKKDFLLGYADTTYVAHVPLTDFVTFHGTEEEQQIMLTMLGALAVNRCLMLRKGYDGLLALGPECSSFEQFIRPSVKPILQQLVDLEHISDKCFYLTFGNDRTDPSRLSLGGINARLFKEYRWSKWLRIVIPTDGDWKWSLFLDSVVIRKNDGTIVDTKVFPDSSRTIMHFDSGTSLSHYSPDLFSFFLDNKLILEEDCSIFCKTEMAAELTVLFILRGGCKKTWTLEIPGIMFHEYIPHRVKVQNFNVASATIASTGDLQANINIWGNKHMKGMGVGFDAENLRIRFGQP